MSMFTRTYEDEISFANFIAHIDDVKVHLTETGARYRSSAATEIKRSVYP